MERSDAYGDRVFDRSFVALPPQEQVSDSAAEMSRVFTATSDMTHIDADMSQRDADFDSILSSEAVKARSTSDFRPDAVRDCRPLADTSTTHSAKPRSATRSPVREVRLGIPSSGSLQPVAVQAWHARGTGQSAQAQQGAGMHGRRSTIPCMFWLGSGSCRYGYSCGFAHPNTLDDGTLSHVREGSGRVNLWIGGTRTRESGVEGGVSLGWTPTPPPDDLNAQPPPGNLPGNATPSASTIAPAGPWAVGGATSETGVRGGGGLFPLPPLASSRGSETGGVYPLQPAPIPRPAVTTSSSFTTSASADVAQLRADVSEAMMGLSEQKQRFMSVVVDLEASLHATRLERDRAIAEYEREKSSCSAASLAASRTAATAQSALLALAQLRTAHAEATAHGEACSRELRAEKSARESSERLLQECREVCMRLTGELQASEGREALGRALHDSLLEQLGTAEKDADRARSDCASRLSEAEARFSASLSSTQREAECARAEIERQAVLLRTREDALVSMVESEAAMRRQGAERARASDLCLVEAEARLNEAEVRSQTRVSAAERERDAARLEVNSLSARLASREDSLAHLSAAWERTLSELDRARLSESSARAEEAAWRVKASEGEAGRAEAEEGADLLRDALVTLQRDMNGLRAAMGEGLLGLSVKNNPSSSIQAALPPPVPFSAQAEGSGAGGALVDKAKVEADLGQMNLSRAASSLAVAAEALVGIARHTLTGEHAYPSPSPPTPIGHGIVALPLDMDTSYGRFFTPQVDRTRGADMQGEEDSGTLWTVSNARSARPTRALPLAPLSLGVEARPTPPVAPLKGVSPPLSHSVHFAVGSHPRSNPSSPLLIAPGHMSNKYSSFSDPAAQAQGHGRGGSKGRPPPSAAPALSAPPYLDGEGPISHAAAHIAAALAGASTQSDHGRTGQYPTAGQGADIGKISPAVGVPVTRDHLPGSAFSPARGAGAVALGGSGPLPLPTPASLTSRTLAPVAFITRAHTQAGVRVGMGMGDDRPWRPASVVAPPMGRTAAVRPPMIMSNSPGAPRADTMHAAGGASQALDLLETSGKDLAGALVAGAQGLWTTLIRSDSSGGGQP